MKLKWLGHSCFLLTASSGATLLTDPYSTKPYGSAMRYRPVEESPDVVTITHEHADHNNPEALGGQPEIIRAPGPRRVAGFDVLGIRSYHDKQHGAQRGDNTIFRITADDMTLCHLGDLGHVLEPDQVEELGRIDVLLIPVGGTYTVDAAGATRVWQQLNPLITVPMHYRNAQCSLNIERVDPFLAGKPHVERLGGNTLELEKEKLPPVPKIVVMEPAN